MTTRKVIMYRRVSTSEQGQSGLGLEAQQADIEIFAKANDLEIVAAYFDVASGKGRLENRPELIKAISHCKRERCALIVSKVDRLSRNHGVGLNKRSQSSTRFLSTLGTTRV